METHSSTGSGFAQWASTRDLASKVILQAHFNGFRSLFENTGAAMGIARVESTRKTWLFVILVLPCLANCAAPTNPRSQPPPSEYQVKAAHLLNVLKFVEWPEDSFADPLAPIVIGVVGEDPFGRALPEVVIGKTVQGRDLVFRKYRVGEDLRGAHLLFISASGKKQLSQILSSLRGSSVLTVADTEGFLEAGGMIQFLNEGGHVRFAINMAAVNGSHLKVSAKLLRLAKTATGKASEAGN